MNDMIISRRGLLGLAAASGTAAALRELGAATYLPIEPGTAPPDRVVIDAALPLASPTRGVEAVRAAAVAARRGGIEAAIVPVATTETTPEALTNLLRLHEQIEAIAEHVVLIRGVSDLLAAQRASRLGVIPALYGMRMVNADLDLIPGYRALGVRVMRLSDGWKGRAADGCFERGNTALTMLGRDAVQAINSARIVLDLSQSGRRSSLEALALSRAPVMFSQANAAAVHAHPMNVTDEQIDACARGGGVIGVCAVPELVSSAAAPTLEHLLRHVDYLARRVGVEHVALGLGFDERRLARRSSAADEPPTAQQGPGRYPQGLSSVEQVPALRAALRARGFAETDVRKIAGGNIARVLDQVWRA